ncbi:hypothetical protein [Citrifermentans bremense]|uniref:hypothetical protein n=1 Tax=Citrifermentans bremense TaxID=60035 RepID=UPI000423C5E9|nr:hypothetical protein [Citrifermentans bremense]
MKKMALLSSLVVFASTAAFAAPLATHVPTTGGAVAIYGGTGAAEALAAPTSLVKTSTGVNGLVDYPGNTAYLIITKHTTGSKVFGTCNGVNNIYWRQVTSGTLATTMLTGITSGSAATSSFVGNGWTSY